MSGSAVPTPEAKAEVVFHTFGLLHRMGFRDGDLLLDVMREHDLRTDRSALLASVVEQLVVPRLDQHVVTKRVLTLHNPIRAAVIDGLPADLDSALSPASVTVPVHQILAIASALAEPPGCDTS